MYNNERMCVQKLKPNHVKGLNLLANYNDKNYRNKLKAAFYKNKLWDQNKVIYYTYMQNPNKSLIPRTPYSVLQNSNLPIDILQKELENTP